jgi:hypothetical protein
MALPALSFPVFIDAGLNSGSFDDGTVAEPKLTWESEPVKDMAFWIKIQPGSELEDGSKRYQFVLEMKAPYKPMVLAEGPFDFDADGESVVYKNTWFFANARTIDFPTPEVFGTWEVGFDIRNKNTGEQTDIKKFNFILIDSTGGKAKEGSKWGKFR